MHHTNIDIVCNSGNQFAKKWPNFHKFAFFVVRLLSLLPGDHSCPPHILKQVEWYSNAKSSNMYNSGIFLTFILLFYTLLSWNGNNMLQ